MVVATRTETAVAAYAKGVLADEIPTCRFIRLACRRHLRDLETGHERGLHFDADAAQRAIDFFGFLKHSKGEWAGQPFELSPWQAFVVGCIFGWKRGDGLRRFRLAYVEVPRKNGKSTLAAGVGLYLFIADEEPGAEVYTAATKRDQARITHGEATRMVKASPALMRRVRIYKDNLSIEDSASKYEPLGADADTMDGLNVHAAIIDELHAHKTRDVVDVLETATGARRQPLIFEITTAGFDQESICREHHDYSVQVLENTIEDDTWFGYIAAIDDGDDWTDPETWRKANPNYGVTVKPDDLERKCLKAQHLPAAQNAFLRLHGNVWTEQEHRFVDLALWDENAGEVNEEELAGLECYGGLDLSSVQDMTAWLMVFPYDKDPDEVDILCRFWVPEARLTDPHNRYRAQYQAWARQGKLMTTPGDAVDYGFIKAQILADAKRFHLVDMAIDRLFQGYQVGTDLQEEGIKVVGMGQGFLSMAGPMREFERRLLAKKLHHGGHPVFRWMAANLSVKQDAAGNLKPDKATSQGRIDAFPALMGGLDRAMRHETARSVYDERGVRYV
jgi:phage terminase large subunit-like protein